MNLNKLLKQASEEDPESLEPLARELTRRGFGHLELEPHSLYKRVLRHPETNQPHLEKWMKWFNFEMDPFGDWHSFEDMPEGEGNQHTRVAFLLLLDSQYELRVSLSTPSELYTLQRALQFKGVRIRGFSITYAR